MCVFFCTTLNTSCTHRNKQQWNGKNRDNTETEQIEQKILFAFVQWPYLNSHISMLNNSIFNIETYVRNAYFYVWLSFVYSTDVHKTDELFRSFFLCFVMLVFRSMARFYIEINHHTLTRARYAFRFWIFFAN